MMAESETGSQDMLELRGEVRSVRDELRSETRELRSETKDLRTEMIVRFGHMDDRFVEMRRAMDQRFTWSIGVSVGLAGMLAGLMTALIKL
jgi:hypothetical protein